MLTRMSIPNLSRVSNQPRSAVSARARTAFLFSRVRALIHLIDELIRFSCVQTLANCTLGVTLGQRPFLRPLVRDVVHVISACDRLSRHVLQASAKSA